MDITGNGAKFNVGIVIHTGSLDTTAGGASAILLPDNYRMEWYEYESLTRTAFITAQVYNDDHPQSLVFGTGGLAYKNGDDETIFLMQDNQGTVVNYFYVTGAVADASPALYAAGTNDHINVRLIPKGANGHVQYGTRTADATATINGYVTRKDASGNLIYIATVTPTP
jgi:hypothetical protein